jgi:hypothetical protein
MYEDLSRLSSLSDAGRYGALLIALIFLTSPAQVRADAQAPPDVIHFCWTNCFSLSYGNGLYSRTDGTDETWTVERFSSTSVILHRHSVPAAWNGFSPDVIYQGQASNDRLVNVTLNGRAAPDINMAWGAALDTLPGSNAERDRRNAAQTKEQAIDASPPPPTELDPGVVEVDMRAADAPPALLNEEQAPCTGDGYLWTPGYWAWGGGYYWVPGAWVLPPRAGLLWTPGYWGYSGAIFAFHRGYWGPHIGFYGGVNYGFGYPGVGFVGGRWVGNSFAYNRSVYHVDTAVIHNSYNEPVASHVGLNNVSYNGGPGGLTATATAQERAAAAEPHISPTAWQRQHLQQAAGNPAFMARANDPQRADTHAADMHPAAAHPAAAFTPRAAASSAPPAQSSTARSAHAGAAPSTVEHPNRVHRAPTPATNAEGTAAQPAKPKSAGETTKSPHPPKR